MNKIYILGKNKTMFEIAEFPEIALDEKIGILFEGDIESTLLAVIAKELYGIDRVVFINDRLITFEETLFYKKDENKLDIAKKTFEQGVARLGGVHSLIIDPKIYNRNQHPIRTFKKLLIDKYQDKLKFVLSGDNKIHEQSISMLKECGWGKGKITEEKIKPWLEKNAKKYSELYKHVIEQNNRIFGMSKYVGFEQIESGYYLQVRPFRNLMSSEVIDLYEQMGFISHLYRTSSCDVDVGNCGICRGCAERKSAFSNSSVSDLTKYTFK